MYYVCVFNNSQITAHSSFTSSKNKSLSPVLSNFKINYESDCKFDNHAKNVLLRFDAVSLQDISRLVSRKFANISAEEVTKIYFTEVLTRYSDIMPEQCANVVLHTDDRIQLKNLTIQNHIKLQADNLKSTKNTAVRKNRNRKLFTTLQTFLQCVRQTVKLFFVKLVNRDAMQN